MGLKYIGQGVEALVQALQQIDENAPLKRILSKLKRQGVRQRDILNAWMMGHEDRLTCSEAHTLRRARNVLGPTWLAKNWRKL